MFGERTLLFFEKAGIYLAALVIVVFAILALDNWADPFRDFFLKTGRWEEFIVISVFVFGLGYILQYLFRLLFRVEANVRQKRGRWR